MSYLIVYVPAHRSERHVTPIHEWLVKRATVMHSFTGMPVVLFLSLLLRGMCLDMRVMGLWLLTSPTTSPDNPPLLRTYNSARNCLAHTPLPCLPPDEAHLLAMFWALLAAAA